MSHTSHFLEGCISNFYTDGSKMNYGKMITSCFATVAPAKSYCHILVYACGPKTVPVKRTFLNIAIVGWGGVGWGGGAC